MCSVHSQRTTDKMHMTAFSVTVIYLEKKQYSVFNIRVVCEGSVYVRGGGSFFVQKSCVVSYNVLTLLLLTSELKL